MACLSQPLSIYALIYALWLFILLLSLRELQSLLLGDCASDSPLCTHNFKRFICVCVCLKRAATIYFSDFLNLRR